MVDQAEIHTSETNQIEADQPDTVRLKHLASVNPPKSEISELPPETDVTFVPLEGFGTNGRIEDSEITSLDEVYQGYTYFREGDIAIAKITPSFENGKGAICEGLKNQIGFGTTELHILRPRQGTNTKFIWYVLRAKPFMDGAEADMRGVAGQKRVPSEFVETYRVPEHSPERQQAIADFLDRHTARIDALIEKKQRLLELIEQRKQAVIDYIITHGVSDDADLVDSESDLLPKIPSGWSMMRLKYISPEITVGVVVRPSQYYSEEGVPFLMGSNIQEGYIDTTDCKRLSHDDTQSLSKSRLRAGDLLTVRVGDPGRTAVVPESLEGANCASVLLVRGSGNFESDWLMYAINSRVGQDQIDLVEYGAAQKQFNVEHAVEFEFPVPPRDVQSEISEYLEEVSQAVRRFRDDTDRQLNLLEEKRQALITAAVTGQIDVTETHGETQDLTV